MARIVVGGAEYYANVDPRVAAADLKIGAQILVNEAYAVIKTLGYDLNGPVLKLTEALPDGRLRFEQEMGRQSLILQRSSDLVGVELKAGDELRIDPGHRIAIEKLEDRKAKTHVLDEVPTVSWEQIGGQQDAISAIRKAIDSVRGGKREEPAFEPTPFELGQSPVRGDAGAPLVLVEFSDYQCPFCRRHALQVLPELLKNYVDTGKLRFVMKESPLPSLHPQAEGASQAALCAQDQGKYWEMHDALFAKGGEMGAEQLKARAAEIGLDAAAFAACLDGGKHADRVAADQALAQKLGVQGTPNFFIGKADPADPGRITLVQRIPGAVAFPVFKTAIDALLAPAEVAAPAEAAAEK